MRNEKVSKTFHIQNGFPKNGDPFWTTDYRTGELILNPNYIDWVDTKDKASGSKAGKVSSALRQIHRLEKDWQRTDRFTYGYRGKPKTTLLIEFKYAPHDQFVANVGKIRFTLEEIPNPQNDNMRYYCVAKYMVNNKHRKRIAGAYGATKNSAIINLCQMHVWYLYKDAMAWVGLDFIFSKIHIRFPLSRIPFPSKFVRWLEAPCPGRFIWDWLN